MEVAKYSSITNLAVISHLKARKYVLFLYDRITFRAGFSQIADLCIAPHFTDASKIYVRIITALNLYHTEKCRLHRALRYHCGICQY